MYVYMRDVWVCKYICMEKAYAGKGKARQGQRKAKRHLYMQVAGMHMAMPNVFQNFAGMEKAKANAKCKKE